MVDYILTNCVDCGAVFDALARINRILSKYAKNKYQNNAYLLTKPFPKDKIDLLLDYKTILEDCKWDTSFYMPYFDTPVIISRVKILTNGL